MEQQLATLYQKLANHIVAMIPVKWTEFHYLGEVERGRRSYSSVFYFRDGPGGKWIHSNDIPKLYQIPKSIYMLQWSELNDILLELYGCFGENGQPLWEQMSFSVDQSGKFKVDYRYDVIGENDGGHIARELVWAYHTFGYMPEEGTPFRGILEKYL